MNCDYVRLLNRYADGALSGTEKETIKKHVHSCSRCALELKNIHILRENISQNKIENNPEFFWQTLKNRIEKETQIAQANKLVFLDFGIWAKRLIPVPIIISLLIVVFLNTMPTYTNPIDEYLFNNQYSNDLELIETPRDQLGIDGLLY